MNNSSDSKAATSRRYAWSTQRQLSVLGIAAVSVVVVAAMIWLVGRSGRSGAAPPAPPPGTFIPTAQQLKTLTIETVAMRPFVSEERTEGKIAVNGEHETPVFSPYSGRIIKVIANLGDVVKQGQPLATIEASEFSQAQNDLRTALAQDVYKRQLRAWLSLRRSSGSWVAADAAVPRPRRRHRAHSYRRRSSSRL